jgi:TonB-dependent SusC/RagA subfamily outer membrane receptor
MNPKINTYGILMVFFLALAFQTSAQQKRIVGRVTTFGSYGLNKVVIKAKSSDKEIVTDANGYYNIDCQLGDKLIFEASGFIKQTVNLKKIDADSVNVDLKLKDGDKNFKMATGYGYIDEDKLSYAIQHFESNNDFSNYASVLDIIQGRLTGVSVGTDAITIRGKNTYAADPALIVVDGNIVNISYLKNMPTSQVKSVDVLKSASASARYGSRGMNGVIVIQTKSKN